jgi:hypothetical protein
VNSVDNFLAKSFACRRKIWKHHQQSSPNGEHFWADYLPGNLKPARKNVVRVFQKCNTPDDLLW